MLRSAYPERSDGFRNKVPISTMEHALADMLRNSISKAIYNSIYNN